MTPNPYHIPLTTRPDILAAVTYINNKVQGVGYNFMEDTKRDYRSLAGNNSFEGESLQIVLGSFDFSYYHTLEMVFYDIVSSTLEPETYWWDHWTRDQLEVKEIESGIFEFRFNRGPDTDSQYIIKAKGFSYCFENVGHVDI